jgi:hypothetical protein
MGKRSKFKHRKQDFYPTPFKATLPLIPHLTRPNGSHPNGVRRFAEPCCGDGRLVRHLESFGLACVYAGDIADGRDALARDNYGNIDAVITNPPHTHEVLSRLLPHFMRIAPTWLLLPMDFVSNARDAVFLAASTDVVPFGRVCWIDGTTDVSKDNFAWLRFQQGHRNGPRVHPRGTVDVFSVDVSSVDASPVNTTVNTRVDADRNKDRHSPGYMAAYMRRRRASSQSHGPTTLARI